MPNKYKYNRLQQLYCIGGNTEQPKSETFGCVTRIKERRSTRVMTHEGYEGHALHRHMVRTREK
jgi:hypothetical protein